MLLSSMVNDEVGEGREHARHHQVPQGHIFRNAHSTQPPRWGHELCEGGEVRVRSGGHSVGGNTLFAITSSVVSLTPSLGLRGVRTRVKARKFKLKI